MNYHAMTHEELVALIESRERMAERVRELREMREKALLLQRIEIVKSRDHLARTTTAQVQRANARADKAEARFDERATHLFEEMQKMSKEIERVRDRNRELAAENARLRGRTPAYFLEPTPAAKAIARKRASEYDEVRRELEEFDATVRRMKRQLQDLSIERAALVARLNVLKEED